MDYRSRYREVSDERGDHDTHKLKGEAENNRKEEDESISNEARPYWGKCDDHNPDEGETPDLERGILVGRRGKEKGQGSPERGEGSAEEKSDDAGLSEQRLCDSHDRHSPENFEIVETFVLGRVIWEEEVKQDQG